MYRKRTISGRATPGASYVYSGHHKIVSLRARAAHSTKLLYFFQLVIFVPDFQEITGKLL